MDNSAVDNIVEDLSHIFPTVGKKLLQAGFKDIARERNISPPHLMIMHLLDETGPMPISEIGRGPHISKPQMTRLIAKMVDLGLVERQPNARDRRVINIALTRRGRRTLKGCDAILKESAKQQLYGLSEDDMRELSDSLRRVREIVSKVQQEV